jgi:DNA gyrase subunit A
MKIGELVRDKKIEGIADIRDESDKSGMRAVIELKRGENPDVILNNLWNETQLEDSFGMNMVALVDGQPRVLNLKQFLQHFLVHRREVVVRRTQYDLRKAEERAHILEGLKIAIDHLDEVITIIRERAAGSARRDVQRSGWQIRHEIRGHFSSAITITKSSAGQSRKSSKGYVISDRTKTDQICLRRFVIWG